MASQPDLSIIILNYKMDGLVKNCLKSIYSHAPKANVEVIVVDNNSQDHCERMVTNHFPQARFIQTGDNYGYAKGNNIGIQQATGRHILLVNPDVVFLDPVFDEIIELMDKHETVGMATVQLRSPDGSIQPGAWRFHTIATPLYQRIRLLRDSRLGQSAIQEFEMKDWNREDSRPVDWVQGSCMIIRREALKDIGLLDEDFFMYFTDVDWCRRCWDAGWKVYYFARPKVIHYYHRESAETLGVLSLKNKVTRIHIKDWLRYLWKYRRQTQLKRS